ncbi:hypothetical protein [Oceanithermus sp.]|uniref:hypothetical protein n=1 Tax=Oceanithermus sp. TaxID=2268145 RepID=UPI00257B1BA7|nr:hypothetical protein [Oceanithermus sp.]
MTKHEPTSFTDAHRMLLRAEEELRTRGKEAIERALDAIRVADAATEGTRGPEVQSALTVARELAADTYGQMRATETALRSLRVAMRREEEQRDQDQD